MTGNILRVEKVTVDFNGFKALDHIDFCLGHHELRFVIGPNGAGKTTLVDVISGRVRTKAGRVEFMGQKNIGKLQEHEIVRLGIGRKFQTPSVFPDLSVFENLELASGYRLGVRALTGKTRSAETERIYHALGTVGLVSKALERAGSLSHGEKQWLEIGMVLVQEPMLLLLDEPVAGMTRQERAKTGELLKEIARGRSVMVIEHDMEFVRRFSTKVTVLHEGKVLSEGTLEQVQNDQRVIETYLGRGRASSSQGPGAGHLVPAMAGA